MSGAKSKRHYHMGEVSKEQNNQHAGEILPENVFR